MMKLPSIAALPLLAAAGAVALSAIAPVATAEAGTVKTTMHQRAKASNVAISKVGRPYAWGATGPSSFDCSGLVAYAYKKARKPLRVRTSYEMWRVGKRVGRSHLRKGDLVFTWDRSLGHVGIYIGRNRYVHAPGAGRHVMVAPLPGGSAFIGAVRP